MERARQGDEHAYQEIVKRYQQVAFRTAYVITRSAAEAEDATQEAFVKAYRALGRFRPGAEPRPWNVSRIVGTRIVGTSRTGICPLALVGMNPS